MVKADFKTTGIPFDRPAIQSAALPCASISASDLIALSPGRTSCQHIGMTTAP
jgi:hypothetical protein